MATVKINPPAPVDASPSAQIVGGATETALVTDTHGRTLKIRKRLGLGERMRLNRMAGADNAVNGAWIGPAMLVSAVVEIDGVPVARPTKPEHIEALADQIGDEGLNLAAEVMSAFIADLSTGADGMDRAKNSAGTPD